MNVISFSQIVHITHFALTNVVRVHDSLLIDTLNMKANANVKIVCPYGETYI